MTPDLNGHVAGALFISLISPLPAATIVREPSYGVKGGLRPSPTAITTLDSFGRSLESGL